MTKTNLAKHKDLTLMIYILYLVSAAIGITAVIALIINYVKRRDVVGSIYESHFNWQIRTAWVFLLVFFISLILLAVGLYLLGHQSMTIFFLALAVMFIDGIWFLYRNIKGLIRLTKNSEVN